MSRCVVVLLLTITAGVSHAVAQGVQVSPQGVRLSGFPKIDLPKTLDFWQDAERERSLGRLNLHIDVIREECDLPAPAVRRLEIAAKGVLDRRIQRGRDQLRLFIFRSGLMPPPEGEEPAADQTPKDDPDRLRISGAASQGEGVIAFRTALNAPASAHPRWLRELTRVLSDEQQQRYEAWATERHGFQYEAVARRWIADLDAVVILGTQQRERITELLAAARPAREPLSGPATLQQLHQHIESRFGDLKHGLAELLTEAQTAHWSKIRETRNFRGVGWTSR